MRIRRASWGEEEWQRVMDMENRLRAAARIIFGDQPQHPDRELPTESPETSYEKDIIKWNGSGASSLSEAFEKGGHMDKDSEPDNPSAKQKEAFTVKPGG